jgi:lysophospholipase L1-like esterase
MSTPVNVRTLAVNGLLAVLAFALTVGALEVAVRVLVPQDLDFFNSEKITRPATRSGARLELIPGARSASYIGVPVAINAVGLRDDHEVALPKPPGVFRILGVGDSVTFGYGVRLEETFLKVLEQRLNAEPIGAHPMRYEVLNAGVGATGLNDYYHYIEAAASALEPDVILVNVVLNDIEPPRNTEGTARPAAAGSPGLVRQINGALLLHSEAYLLAYTSFKSLLYRARVLDINRVHEYDFLPLEPPSDKQGAAWRASLAWLDRIASLTRSRGWPLVVAIFPMEVQLTPELLALYRREFGTRLGSEALSGDPQRRVREWGASRDVPVVDVLPTFRAAAREPLYLRNRAITYDPVHPNPLGHRIAGAALYDALAPALSRSPATLRAAASR